MDNGSAPLTPPLVPPSSPAEEIKVRDRLLTAATRLFTEKGYSAASVGEIVAAAGVTKPILYYYFKNKEGIYLEIIQKAYGGLERLLDSAETWTGTAHDRLLRLGEQVLNLFVENLEAARLIHAIYYGPPQGAPAYDYDAHYDRYMGMVVRLVCEGIEKGEFKPLDPEDVALGIAAILEKAMDLQLLGRGMRLDPDRQTRMLEIFFNGVLRKV